MLQSSPYPVDVLVAIGWIGIFLILGAACRVCIPFCRKYLIPGCMIGGLLGCIATNTGLLSLTGSFAPTYNTMQFIVFHLFNLSFVCMGLMGIPASRAGRVIKGSVFNCCLASVVSNFQVLIGIGLIVLYNVVFGTQLFESAGQLLMQGFAAGPGAALTYGAIFEQAGIPNMISLGLAFAAVGYLTSLVFGVPIANIIRKKRGITADAFTCSASEGYGIYEEGCQPSAGKLRFMNNNIDTLSFQMALVAISYMAAFAIMGFLENVLPKNVMAMIWGLFAFLVCMPCGLIMRELLIKRVFRCEHLFDPETNSRIMNLTVDYIAVGSLVGISLLVVREWIVLLVLMSVASALVTAAVLWWATRKMKEDYYPAEHMLGLFGNLTGTITTGFVLMRMVDPEFKSTVPQEMSLQGIVSMILGLPFMAITQPIMFSQVLYNGGYMPIIYMALVFIVVYGIIIKLPFWHNQDSIAKF